MLYFIPHKLALRREDCPGFKLEVCGSPVLCLGEVVRESEFRTPLNAVGVGISGTNCCLVFGSSKSFHIQKACQDIPEMARNEAALIQLG